MRYPCITGLASALLGIIPAVVPPAHAQDPTLEKTLVSGPAEIGIALPAPTVFVFEISYSNPAGVPVRVLDTVPAEFEIVSLSASAGMAEHFKAHKKAAGQARGEAANRIVWDLDAGVGGTLTVTIQTVQSPGRGHARKGALVYKPTSCGELSLNDGATAFELDPETGRIVTVEVADPVTGEVSFEAVIVAGPSEGLAVEAVAGAKPCVEVEEEATSGL
jgi:hypothetical protein